jgi:hypothetical protein
MSADLGSCLVTAIKAAGEFPEWEGWSVAQRLAVIDEMGKDAHDWLAGRAGHYAQVAREVVATAGPEALPAGEPARLSSDLPSVPDAGSPTTPLDAGNARVAEAAAGEENLPGQHAESIGRDHAVSVEADAVGESGARRSAAALTNDDAPVSVADREVPLAFFGPSPRPLSRKGLTAAIERARAAREEDSGAGGMPLGECLTLLKGLRREIFPGGVASAGSADHPVMGAERPESGLAPGGWHRVSSWAAVVSGLMKQEPGSAVFILARGAGAREGHAFAAYLDAEGKATWVELLAEPGGWFPEEPKARATDARAVLVGPGGRVVEGAFEEFTESSTLAHALIDAPASRDYGGIGFEDEFLFPVRVKEGSPEIELVYGDPVSTSSEGFTLTIEDTHLWLSNVDGRLYSTELEAKATGDSEPGRMPFNILEFASPALGLDSGDKGRIPAEDGMEYGRRVKAALDLANKRNASVSLEEAIKQGDIGAWKSTPLGEVLELLPGGTRPDDLPIANLRSG